MVFFSFLKEIGHATLRPQRPSSNSMHIKVKKGLRVPLLGGASGPLQLAPPPARVACDLTPFAPGTLKLLIQEGVVVERGAPVAQEKKGGFVIASPAGGRVASIRRGDKRRPLEVIIEIEKEEPVREWASLIHASPQSLYTGAVDRGALPHIQKRPFGGPPKKWPRDIFISLHVSAPFSPSWQWHIERNYSAFERGLWALSQWVSGSIHLVSSTAISLPNIPKLRLHTVEGPHPSGLSSVHIHRIAPILSARDSVWSLSPAGVTTLGGLIEGRYPIERVIALAGEGIKPHQRGFFLGRMGCALRPLLEDRLDGAGGQIISGDPLTGAARELDDFLGFDHTTIAVLPTPQSREPLHFLGTGKNKFSCFKAYLSGWKKKSGYPFTTTQHGEERAFIDPKVYQRVMPLDIPVVPLIKALLAQDYELAERLGLLETLPEDFALPTFVCPSKIHIMDIVSKALAQRELEIE